MCACLLPINLCVTDFRSALITVNVKMCSISCGMGGNPEITADGENGLSIDVGVRATVTD